MLFGLFGSSTVVPKHDESEGVDLEMNTEITSKLFENISCEEAINLIQKVNDDGLLIQLFFSYPDRIQDHVFPLLDAHQKDIVFGYASEDRQSSLLIQMEAFTKQQQESMVCPNKAENIFFLFAAHNALKYHTQNKYVYAISADKVVHLDIKPYKYQRKLMERHVQCIADGIQMSKMMYHPLIVAWVPTKNSFTIMDGQHRWAALKRLPVELLASIDVQFDVICFSEEDGDEVIMKYYKYINTNVPMDVNRLEVELRYVGLVDSIRAVFGKQAVRTFTKDIKEPVPEHFIIDSWLKEELQYREILSKMNENVVLAKLQYINTQWANDASIDMDMSRIDSRMCKREGFYLGYKWPRCLDALEQQ